MAILVIMLGLSLWACSASPEAAPPQPTAGPPVIPSPSAATGDRFEVQVWVDQPNPAQGERVNLSGSLIKNGIYLGGMMMEANWPDEDQERGMPNCYVLMIYQRGVCWIETKDYPVGEYVPVAVKFRYNNLTFSGETGFTVEPAKPTPTATGND